jgi:hypothetical protein
MLATFSRGNSDQPAASIGWRSVGPASLTLLTVALLVFFHSVCGRRQTDSEG